MSYVSFIAVIASRMAVIAATIAVALISPAASLALTLHYSVPGTTMPWVSSDNLNGHYRFGLGDGTAPIDVGLHLLHAHSGETIVVKYVSGTVNAGSPWPNTDAAGDTSYPTNNHKNGAGRFPSFYMTPYPIYLCELVGTFTDRKGKIIGLPFAIGDGPASFVVPAGASIVLLGVNDNKFSDNGGSWVISISKQK